MHVAKPSVQAAQVNALHFGERRPARPHVTPVMVKQPHPQRLQETAARVVGGAAAEPDDDRLGAGVERGPDQFARAV